MQMVEPAGGAVGAFGHGAAAVTFSLLTIILAVLWARGRPHRWLTNACAITALWGWACASGALPATVLGALDIVRAVAWSAYLFSLLARIWAPRQRVRALAVLAAAVVGVCVLALAYEVFSQIGNRGLAAALDAAFAGFDYVARLLLAVVGLLLVENLFRNAGPEDRPTVNPLCTGLGGWFAFDFFLYSDALLFKMADPDLLDARGYVAAAVAPMILVLLRRDPDPTARPAVSRQTVFHTATFVGAGAYLLIMWAVAVYIREYGGQWGTVLQTVFLFAAFLVLVGVLFSGSFRARVKILISKHFFHYRYDYREEWLRFIRTMSSEHEGTGLTERVIRAIAEIVDSPRGILWDLNEGGAFEPGGAWRTAPPARSLPADPCLVAFFETRRWVIDLRDLADRPDDYDGLDVPDGLLALPNPWLLVPLLYRDRLMALVVLHAALAPRRLDWEDYDILKTAGRQAAQDIAAQRAAARLAEARRFDDFNRRFAFVLHDVKNLISQLSLLLANAKKHRHDPAFQEDVFETIQESVTKMNHLLIRLNQGGNQGAAAIPVDLAPFLKRLVHRHSQGTDNPEFDCRAGGAMVLADEQRLGAVLSHLIANAQDAVAADGRVSVRLALAGDDAEICVIDDGIGMAPEFVRDRLFRPFETSKTDGYGLGVYECRQYVRELGGRMDVDSVPGRGTTVRVLLPLAAPAGRHDRPGLAGAEP